MFTFIYCFHASFLPPPLLWHCLIIAVFPAAPTPSPAYSSVHSRLPAESSFTADAMPGDVRHFPDLEGTAGLTLDSAPAAESEGTTQVSEQPDDLPRQIHIQQHLKLHFQPQGKA